MNKKDFIKTIAVFSTVALICGIILGLFVQLAHISDTEREQRAISVLESFSDCRDFEAVNFKSSNDKLDKKIQHFFYDAKKDVYAVVAGGEKGYGDIVTMYIIIKDDKIAALKAGDNKETPGISDPAFGNYLESFLNKNVYKLGSKFTEVVTGATYSKNAIRSSIKNAVDFYLEYKNS